MGGFHVSSVLELPDDEASVSSQVLVLSSAINQSISTVHYQPAFGLRAKVIKYLWTNKLTMQNNVL
jgi:hypothetical protein